MVYPITIAFSVFFAWLASRAKNKSVRILCSVISVLIPSIVGGLRQVGVGIDTLTYGAPDAFKASVSKSFLEFAAYREYKELGYSFVCYVTMQTLGHINWCFFFYQLITVGCFYVGAYKHRKIAPLPFIMFIFLYMDWVNSFNIMRQCMASSIIVMGIDHLEKKEYIKFMIYVIIAYLFHTSALVCIVLVLGIHMIVTHRSAYLRYFVILLIMLIILNFRTIIAIMFEFLKTWEAIPTRYQGYMGGTDGNTDIGSRIRLLSYLGAYIIFCIYSRRGQKLLGGLNLEYYKFNTFLCFGLPFILGGGIFSRLLGYNRSINYIVMAAMPFCVKDKYMRLLLILAVIFSLVGIGVKYRIGNASVSSGIDTYTYRSILF